MAKTDPRTEAYGDVDEAISALGAARALINDRGRHAIILRVQSELFTVGAELATDSAEYGTLQRHFKVVTADFTTRCEAEIADLEGRITLPDAFVIPGGTQPAAALDLARAIVRRAERRIVGLHNPAIFSTRRCSATSTASPTCSSCWRGLRRGQLSNR